MTSALCTTCAHKHEANRLLKACKLQGCCTLFRSTGTARYCMVHRGLTAREKRRAEAELAA